MKQDLNKTQITKDALILPISLWKRFYINNCDIDDSVVCSMAVADEEFNVTFIQNIETERYVVSLLGLLDELNIRYKASDKIRYSTTKVCPLMSVGNRCFVFLMQFIFG